MSNEFKNPPSHYHPIVFWSWNERMDTVQVKHQLDLMTSVGIGGGFIHSRIGLISEYLGKEWFDAVDVVVDQSRKKGIKVYLYDEDKWPSGFAGGKVPMSDKSFRLKALVARGYGDPFPDDCEKIGDFENQISIYKWTAPVGHDWFNGTCYSDMMNKEAMQLFLKESYESYYSRYSEFYGDTVVCEFTDEPCSIFRGRVPHGAVPYTDALPMVFEELHGYCPVGHFHKLFINCEGSEGFRIHYYKTVNYLFEYNFSKPLGQWCQEHKIALTGHYMMESELYGQQLWGTKVMPNYRHQQWPGIDHLGRSIDEIITAKQCQSVVNQFGKERMISEMFGCSGQGLTFEDRLWIASQQIQLGVNLINPHLSLYTMAGCRKRDFPPNLFYQQPWWSVNDQIDRPLSRLCYMISRGQYDTDVLIIHPQDSVFALWQTRYENCINSLEQANVEWDTNCTTADSKEKIDQLDISIKEFIKQLQDNQCQFDFGDETIINDDAQLTIAGDKPCIKIGRICYSKIIVPDMVTIAESSVDLLEEFIKLGGVVYATKNTPVLMDGQRSKKLEELLKKVTVADKKDIVRKISSDQKVKLVNGKDNQCHVWTHVRALPDNQKMIFISNLNRSETFDGTVCVEGSYNSVVLYDHWDGEQKRVVHSNNDNRILIPLTLQPVQSRLIVLNAKNTIAGEVSLKNEKLKNSIELPAEKFKVQRLDDNALIIDKAFFKEGDGRFSQKALPLTAIQERLNRIRYAGKVELKYKFKVIEIPQGSISLVVEHPENYSIFVNDKKINAITKKFWLDFRFIEIDITRFVIRGENEVHLICNDFHYGDHTSYEDISKRYGTEIEAIYIKGDFNVCSETIESDFDESYWQKTGLKPELKFIDNNSIAITKASDLKTNHVTEQALPFYAGKIEYSTILPEIKTDSNIILNLEKLNAPCAQVYIDDKLIGSILTLPYILDITNYYSAGKTLRIVFYSSLRNLLGPHHHKDGENIFTSPFSFLPSFESGSDYSEMVIMWDKNQAFPFDYNDSYCILDFANIGRVSIEFSGESDESS